MNAISSAQAMEAWAPLVEAGYEVPAAGQAMRNAALEIRQAALTINQFRDLLHETRTTLSILQSQIMAEIRCDRSQWDGVPEELRLRIAAIDDMLKE